MLLRIPLALRSIIVVGLLAFLLPYSHASYAIHGPHLARRA
jgi:hypothetical protein